MCLRLTLQSAQVGLVRQCRNQAVDGVLPILGSGQGIDREAAQIAQGQIAGVDDTGVGVRPSVFTSSSIWAR